MLAAQFVEPGEQRRRRKRFAVDRHRITALESDFNIFRRIRRIFGMNGALVDIIGGFHRRVFEDFAFRRSVQQVCVYRKPDITCIFSHLF